MLDVAMSVEYTCSLLHFPHQVPALASNCTAYTFKSKLSMMVANLSSSITLTATGYRRAYTADGRESFSSRLHSCNASHYQPLPSVYCLRHPLEHDRGGGVCHDSFVLCF